jgi:hypothetical protein
MCPWIECGEPIVEELADGPEAVEWLEGAVRRSGDSYWGASVYMVEELNPVLAGYPSCVLGYE